MEFEDFTKKNGHLSKASIATYNSQYKKLRLNLPKDQDIAEYSEKELLKYIKTISKPNSQQSMINIAILVLKMKEKSVDKLLQEREKNKLKIQELVKIKNIYLGETLPKYEELVNHTQSLYDDGKWTDFIINYLLLNFQVRNKDLLFDIVLKKKDMTDENKNYIWYNKAKSSVHYVRNNYKTASTYGKKINIITDISFVVAIKGVIAHQKFKETNGVFIPNESQLGYYICRASYNKICEGNFVKIIINHFRNDIDKLKEISENRGTSVSTLLSNYDIEFT